VHSILRAVLGDDLPAAARRALVARDEIVAVLVQYGGLRYTQDRLQPGQ
jgi:hypothetical protein